MEHHTGLLGLTFGDWGTLECTEKMYRHTHTFLLNSGFLIDHFSETWESPSAIGQCQNKEFGRGLCDSE